MAPYKQVEGLTRGLNILKALNTLKGASVGDIAKQTRINRTTVYRVLETLIQLGYVSRCHSDGRFYVTGSIRQLSDGFDDDAWVAEVGGPHLSKLYKDIVWPCDLLTLEGDAMVVRETTYRTSPLAIYRSTVGSRWSVLGTASGRAHLAFCGDKERTELLSLLARSSNPADALAKSPESVARLIHGTRKAGYGQSCGEVNHNIAAISIPISHADRVLACLSVIFFAKAMPVEEAAKRFLPRMREAAKAIENELQGWQPDALYMPHTRIEPTLHA